MVLAARAAQPSSLSAAIAEEEATPWSTGVDGGNDHATTRSPVVVDEPVR